VAHYPALIVLVGGRLLPRALVFNARRQYINIVKRRRF
jgi:hypothetical protein